MKISKRDNIKYDESLSTLTTGEPLSTVESKIVFNVIAQIDLNDEEFQEYNINASELYDEIRNELRSEARKKSKIKNKVLTVDDIAKEKSKRLEIFCKELRSKTLNLPVENELDFDVVGWFTRFTYNSELDTIVCKLESSLKPYLLEFKNKHYKKGILSNILSFRSKYTHKFYLLLKRVNTDRFISINDFGQIIPISWFREWLGIQEDEYILYADFKRRVLETVKRELAGTVDKKGNPTFESKAKAEVSFSYEEIKTGRKVTHLKLKAIYNPFRKLKPNERALDIDITETECDFSSDQDLENQDIKYFVETKSKVRFINENYQISDIVTDELRRDKINIIMMKLDDESIITHQLTYKDKRRAVKEFIIPSIHSYEVYYKEEYNQLF